MRTMRTLQKAIQKRIEDHCKKGNYETTFSSDFQKIIKEQAENIAVLVTEDEEFLQKIDEAIEEAIRVFVIREHSISHP